MMQILLIVYQWFGHHLMNRIVLHTTQDRYVYQTITPNSFYNRSNIGRIGFFDQSQRRYGDKNHKIFSLKLAFSSNAKQSSREWSYHLAAGGSLNVSATNSGGNASYNLKANAVSINTNTSTSSYSFSYCISDQNYSLEVTQGTVTIIKVFGDCKSGTAAWHSQRV
jgi:hypothetical protein